MKIIPIPVLSDNYAYLIIDEPSNEAAVVDLSEAKPVAKVVQREGVTLTTVINTHHHWDHVGGNKELVKEFRSWRNKLYAHEVDPEERRKYVVLIRDLLEVIETLAQDLGSWVDLKEEGN